MSESSVGSSYINWGNSKFQSNEDTETKTFQRTKSAQVIFFIMINFVFLIKLNLNREHWTMQQLFCVRLNSIYRKKYKIKNK